MNYCAYYQATIDKKNHLFVVGALKYFEHLCFDRTLDVAQGLFEFFVPVDQEEKFVAIMQDLKNKDIIGTLEKLPNRLRID